MKYFLSRILIVVLGVALVAATPPAKSKNSKKTDKPKQKKSSATIVKESAVVPGATPTKKNKTTGINTANLTGDDNFNKLPTFIKSDNLTLHSDARHFTYNGHVEVKHGDMIITSDILDGFYDEQNKIKTLVAQRNVVILKGDAIRGTSERATYDAAADTVILTENPELQQNQSVLTADLIRVFLKENRSEAEGTVRVKMAGEESKGKEALKK